MNARKLMTAAAAIGLLSAPVAIAQTASPATEPTTAQDNATQNEGTAALNAQAKATAMATVAAGPTGTAAPEATEGSVPASTNTSVPAPDTATDTMSPEVPDQNMSDPSAAPAPTPLPQEPEAQQPMPTEPKTDGM